MALKTLFFVKDIMERYHLASETTARRYMKEMGAKGRPMFVFEESITAWEEAKVKPVHIPERIKRTYSRIQIPKSEMIIPRRK